MCVRNEVEICRVSRYFGLVNSLCRFLTDVGLTDWEQKCYLTDVFVIVRSLTALICKKVEVCMMIRFVAAAPCIQLEISYYTHSNSLVLPLFILFEQWKYNRYKKVANKCLLIRSSSWSECQTLLIYFCIRFLWLLGVEKSCTSHIPSSPRVSEIAYMYMSHKQQKTKRKIT